MSILNKIKLLNFPTNQYYRKETDKKQIVLHHTVSPVGVMGDVNWWLSDEKRIATHFIIHHNGTIYQCFNSKYWAHHIGVKREFLKNKGFTDFWDRNVLLNKQSIGIEIDSAGGLDEDLEDVYGNRYQKEWTQEYDNYRGFKHFEKYTEEQIKSLRELLTYLCDKYDIDKSYKDMFEINIEALEGKSGIWSHTSFRKDKSDVHPQPELIDMLKGLDG